MAYYRFTIINLIKNRLQLISVVIARNDPLDLRNISREENFGLGSNFKFEVNF